ncbi:MAG: EipB family protein [Pseudomonadota bacterium]
MLNVRLLKSTSLAAAFAAVAPAAAQELAPHRAVYVVSGLERGKPGIETSGTYAYELRLTCDGYVINQRLRLEAAGQRTTTSEQQSHMTESRDGRRLQFEHRTTSGGRQAGLVKGEASLGDGGRGEARFSDPEGQTVALPAETRFPVAIARETIRRAKAGENGFDALFFFGERVKPPQEVNVVIGRVPRRLADLKIPEGGESLAEGRTRIYYRAGFFDPQSRGAGEPAFEMSSVTLDNGIELYGTHEESDGGIEYRITRLEPLPQPECKK